MQIGFIGKALPCCPGRCRPGDRRILINDGLEGAVLIVALMVLDGIIYYPFFKIYEKNLVKEELGEADGEES